MTHYELLQVSRSASKEVIDVAWKTLMLQHHPDKGGNPAMARKLNQAHDTLSNPETRKLYDLTLSGPKTVRMPRRAEPAYPEAYPPAYPAMDEIVERMADRISEAATQASMDVLEQMARSNPLVRTFLKNLKRRAAG